MPTRKLTEDELHQRNLELAEHVCSLEEAKQNKRQITGELNKEIKYHSELATRIAQEVNSGVIEVDPQGKLL